MKTALHFSLLRILLAGCFFGVVLLPLSAQNTYLQGLWTDYQQAPDFSARKAAFKRLEYFYRYYQVDSCLLICRDFLEQAEREKSDYAPFVEVRIAACHLQKLDFDQASRLLYPLLSKAEALHNDSLQATVLVTLSNLAFRQNQLPQALERARAAARLNAAQGRWTDLVISYIAMANVYNKTNVDSALILYQKGLEIAGQHVADERVTGGLYVNMGTFYHRKGEMEKAIGYYQRAVAEFEKVDERYARCFAILNIGHAFKKMKAYAAALPWFDRALPVCQTCGNLEGEGSIYMGRSQSYEALGDYKAALAAQQAYGAVQTKLDEQTYNRTTQELETKYQTEKKERQMEREKARRNYLFTLIGLVVLLAGGLLLWQRTRQKNALAAAVIREQKLGLAAIIEAQEAERKRIAKDLHDGVAQQLVALQLGFEVLSRRLSKTLPDEADRCADLRTQLGDASTEIRNLAHVMLPPVLEQRGLAPSLELLLRNTAASAGLNVELDCHALPRLDEKVEVGLYRIAQELLNNVIKHAHAARVLLQLYPAGNNLVLRMEDDGQGFDFESARQQGSMGLLNILSRAGNLGGTFFSETLQPHGTVSVVRVPLA